MEIIVRTHHPYWPDRKRFPGKMRTLDKPGVMFERIFISPRRTSEKYRAYMNKYRSIKEGSWRHATTKEANAFRKGCINIHDIAKYANISLSKHLITKIKQNE